MPTEQMPLEKCFKAFVSQMLVKISCNDFDQLRILKGAKQSLL
jgi:hypothetical protein